MDDYVVNRYEDFKGALLLYRSMDARAMRKAMIAEHIERVRCDAALARRVAALARGELSTANETEHWGCANGPVKYDMEVETLRCAFKLTKQKLSMTWKQVVGAVNALMPSEGGIRPLSAAVANQFGTSSYPIKMRRSNNHVVWLKYMQTWIDAQDTQAAGAADTTTGNNAAASAPAATTTTATTTNGEASGGGGETIGGNVTATGGACSACNSSAVCAACASCVY